jgi:hypothetical protein
VELLLDADATVAMRGLSLLRCLLETGVSVAFTGFIYDHELRRPAELELHRARGRVRVHHVFGRTEADQRRRRLLSEDRLDKGEAEAIAWLLEARTNVMWFVTLDQRARQVARANGVFAVDVAELAAGLVVAKVLDHDIVRTHLCVWDDVRNQSGRPRKWGLFDDDFPRLLADIRSRWDDRFDE